MDFANVGLNIALVFIPSLILLFGLIFVAKQYKRCPSNQILVVFGRVGADKTAKCIHGGGTFVIPLIQDYGYLSLNPLQLDIDLKGALSKENIRLNVPSTFTIGISTVPEVMQNAAERLFGSNVQQIQNQASDIIFGQMRQVIASLSINEINQDRDKLIKEVNESVGGELKKIGLELINVNIRDLNDASGYINAIGQRAAAEAVNKANIEVAEQKKIGETGVAEADKERQISVNERHAQTAVGVKKADQEMRIKTAELEAEAVKGENDSRGVIAKTNAELAEREALARQLAEVAKANAAKSILVAEKEAEQAKLEKEQIVQQEIEKRKIQIQAEADAEQTRIKAKGDADAILAKYTAEAEGIRKVLEAKAQGYEKMVKAGGENAPVLLLIEKLPELVEKQVEAIKNIQLGNVTVWDNGNGTTANFLQSLMGSLPTLHNIASQVGVKLPSYLGEISTVTEQERGTK